MRAQKLKSLLEFSLKNNYPILVKGAPGIGKSDIVSQACNNLGYELIISHPVVADPTDYKGLPFVINGKAEFLPFGDLEKLLHADKEIVFFMDDLGQATPAVQSAVMQLILARQINGHKISDFVRFVAATNRRTDMANVSGILEPVKSRFASIVELEVNNDDWYQWAFENGMPSELISFIQFRPGLLFDFKASRDIVNSPNPRTVTFVGKMINSGLPEEIRFETVSGAVGEAWAIEFEAYLKTYALLPSIHQMIADPVNTPIPNEISAKFAAMGLVADKMNSENIKALNTYLQRLGDELYVCGMKNATMKNPSLYSTPEFINFGIKYGNILAA